MATMKTTTPRKSRVTLKAGAQPRVIATVDQEQGHAVTAWSLNEDGLAEFFMDVIGHYAMIAPTVAAWSESLSIRLADAPEKVSAFELRQFSFLYVEGRWMEAHVAANRAYKVMDIIGGDTTGLLGF